MYLSLLAHTWDGSFEHNLMHVLQAIIIGIAFFTLGVGFFVSKYYISRINFHAQFYMWLHVVATAIAFALIAIGISINHVYFLNDNKLYFGSFLFVPGFIAALIGHYSILKVYGAREEKRKRDEADDSAT